MASSLLWWGARPGFSEGFINMKSCRQCSGLVPEAAAKCPHCDVQIGRSRRSRLKALLTGGAASVTLMACYGLPPGTHCNDTVCGAPCSMLGPDGSQVPGVRCDVGPNVGCMSPEAFDARCKPAVIQPGDGGQTGDSGIDGGAVSDAGLDGGAVSDAGADGGLASDAGLDGGP